MIAVLVTEMVASAASGGFLSCGGLGGNRGGGDDDGSGGVRGGSNIGGSDGNLRLTWARPKSIPTSQLSVLCGRIALM